MTPTYDAFSLGADAKYDGEWSGVDVVKADAGIGTKLSFTGNASLCHGVDLGLSGSLTASADAALAIIVAISGEVSGIASAGISARGVLTSDPFDEIGLVLDVGAWAEASAAARIAVGLDTGQILALAGLRLEGLPFELFQAFMNEVRVEAGVWGVASATAKARAHLSCSGKLSNGGDSGFTFEMGAAAGFGLGAGWDFFGGARVENPGRMMSTAAWIVSREITAIAREHLGDEAQVAVELLDLATPLVLRCCHELGAAAAEGSSNGRSQLLETFIKVAEDELRAWTMRRLCDIAERLLADVVERLAESIARNEIDDQLREDVIAKLRVVRALVPEDGFSLETAATLSGPLIEAIEISMPEEVVAVRGPVTIFWLALASAHALWEPGAYGEEGANAALPTPPQGVIDELTASGGTLPQTLRVSDAIAYIADAQILPTMADWLPVVGEVLDLLDEAMGVGTDEIAELLLRGVSGGPLSTSNVFTMLREMLASVLDRLIGEDLMPRLADAMPGNDSRTRYVSDVVHPAILAFARMLLEELEDVAEGNTHDVFDGAFQTALGTLAAKLVGGSAVVLGDVLFGHVLESLPAGLADLRRRVQSGQADALVDALAASVSASIFVPPTTTPSRAALTRLATDLIEAAQAGSGPVVWTPHRRTALRSLLLDAFADFNGPGSDADHDVMRAFFTSVLDCNFIPHPQTLLDSGALITEIGADVVIRTVPRTAAALERFSLAMTLSVIDEIDRLARRFFDDLGELIDSILQSIDKLRGQVDAALRLAEQALVKAQKIIKLITRRLRNKRFRNSVLAAARSQAVKNVVVATRAVPGFTLLPREAQKLVVGTAVATFDVSWNTATPLMDVVLQVSGDAVADTVEQVLRNASSAHTALRTLRSALERTVKRELSNRGVLIPNLSGAALAEIAKSILLTDELSDAIKEVIELRDTAHAQRRAADRLKLAKQRQEDKLAREQKRNRIINVRDLEITVLSPIAFAPKRKQLWKYGSRVPLSIRIRNGFSKMLDEPTRIFLALNGQPLALNPNLASVDKSSMRIRFDLRAGNHPLVNGMNVIECTVLDGRGGVLRKAVTFGCDPSAAGLGDLRIDEARSVFATPQKDHHETVAECVTIFNGSPDDISLRGWRMLDTKNHVFTFPETVLHTGGSITVRTGSGHDTDTTLYWSNKRAIWNIRGDTLHLIDDTGILRLAYGQLAI